MINLLVNAIQAMEQNPVSERYLTISLAADHQNWLLKVADSGFGITAADYPLLFDAFYSTKAEGMGMGLSICRSIAEAHHGLLWAEQPVDQKPGSGAVFYLQLPQLDVTTR